jgi:hypothetical protein
MHWPVVNADISNIAAIRLRKKKTSIFQRRISGVLS